MSIFGKKSKEQPRATSRVRRAPSRHVLDLAKIKQEKQQKTEEEHILAARQQQKDAFPKKTVRSYIPKFFDRPSAEPVRPAASMFHRTPELLDRIFDDARNKRTVRGPGAIAFRSGVFILFVAALLFSVKAVEWKDQADRIKGEILGEATTAFQDLLAGFRFLQSGDFQDGQAILDKARNEFTGIQTKLDQFNQAIVAVARLLPSQGKSIDAGEHLVAGGRELAEGLSALSQSVPRWFPEKTSSEGFNFLTVIDAVASDAEKIAPHLIAARREFLAVDADAVPSEHRQSFEDARTAVAKTADQFAQIQSMMKGIRTLLGAYGERRYLVLFQNNRELRATGGFIGSFSLIDIKDGKITNIETPKGGPYDIAPNLTDFIRPPAPLQFVNSRWEMHDANWFPDFPSSAKKIQWFYDKSGGPTVDGVLAVTPEVLVRLLHVTGPLDIPEYQTTVNETNVIDLLQKQAEDSSDKTENVPKRIISVMFPKMLEKIFSLNIEKSAEALAAFADSFQKKDMLLFVSDENLERSFRGFGWTGEVKSSESDYLMVVGSNIAGGKTDHAIDEWIDHRADVQEDGSIIDTVTITRKHNGNTTDQFENKTNQEYIRAYVPEGSVLRTASGFAGPDPSTALQSPVELRDDEDLARIEKSPVVDERTGVRISQEFGKTVFGGWMTVAPGKFVQAVFVYELPSKIVFPKQSFFDSFLGGSSALSSYSLTFQKQPGKINMLTSSLSLPSSMSFAWNSENAKLAGGNLVLSETVDIDTAYAAVIKAK